MTFEEFCTYVKENIGGYLPEGYEDAEITIMETMKIGENYTGLTVCKPGQSVAPTVNLDMFYREADCEEVSPVMMAKIAELSLVRTPDFELEDITDYEKAKDKLIIRICNAERNRDILKTSPHRMEGEFAVTYHIILNSDADGMGTVLVTDNLLSEFGITKEQLHEDAMKSCRKMMPPVIEPLEMHILGMQMSDGEHYHDFDEMLSEMNFDEHPIMLLSNSSYTNGAAVIMYQGLIEQIGEQLGKNFYIIPSSVHEMLLVSENNMELEHLERTVRQVNEMEVQPKDFLSDNVYHFDVKEKVFEKAGDYKERTAEKEKQAEEKTERRREYSR